MKTGFGPSVFNNSQIFLLITTFYNYLSFIPPLSKGKTQKGSKYQKEIYSVPTIPKHRKKEHETNIKANNFLILK